jgi:predicted TIM-barrel fold metal-dependent hydrolase
MRGAPNAAIRPCLTARRRPGVNTNQRCSGRSKQIPAGGDAGSDACDAPFGSGHSRRRFLQLLAMAGAGALLPAEALLPQAPRRLTGRIDVHHHLVPPFYVKEMEAAIAATGRPLPAWSPEISLEAMDKNGIATAMLSPHNRLVGDSLSDRSEKARTLARRHNEYAARVAADHPQRFGVFAAVPLPDPDGALGEIAYAYDALKVDGVGMWTSYRDKWPGDPAFAAAFDELNRRKAVVYFHPSAPTCCRALVPGVGPQVEEYDFDTARCVTSLLVNGVFDRCPDIRFIISHSGGTLPVLANRISELFPSKSPGGMTPTGVRSELLRIYYEVAHAGYAAPLGALTRLVPTSQILFGSDYPVWEFPVTTAPLDRYGFSARDIQAINRGNAERLFPRLKR